MFSEEFKQKEFFRLKRGGYLPSTVSRMNPTLNNFSLLGIKAEHDFVSHFYSAKIDSQLEIGNLVPYSRVPKSFVDIFILLKIKFEMRFMRGEELCKGEVSYQTTFKRVRGIIKVLRIAEIPPEDPYTECSMPAYYLACSLLYPIFEKKMKNALDSPIPDDWYSVFEL